MYTEKTSTATSEEKNKVRMFHFIKENKTIAVETEKDLMDNDIIKNIANDENFEGWNIKDRKILQAKYKNKLFKVDVAKVYDIDVLNIPEPPKEVKVKKKCPKAKESIIIVNKIFHFIDANSDVIINNIKDFEKNIYVQDIEKQPFFLEWKIKDKNILQAQFMSEAKDVAIIRDFKQYDLKNKENEQETISYKK